MISSEQRMIPRSLAFSTFLLLVTVATGCTTVKEGFGGTEREDITPFAQKTVEVIGVNNIRLRDDELVYLRLYVDDTFVALDHLQDLLIRMDTFQDKVITYSVDLVRVTELYETDEEQVEAYAQSIDDNLRAPVTSYLGVTAQEWDTVLADVRAEEDLLGALRAVQPVVTRAGEYFEELVTEMEATVVFEMRAEFDRRIQAEYAQILKFLSKQYAYRDELMDVASHMDDYERGDEDAIARVRAKDYIVDLSALPNDSPTPAQLREAGRILLEELQLTTEVLRNLEPDVEGYKATRSELDRKETEVLADMGLARVQFATWARAHQALAAGVKDPGSWMELSIKAAKIVKDVL
jgi:hypothetical protein